MGSEIVEQSLDGKVIARAGTTSSWAISHVVNSHSMASPQIDGNIR